MTADAGHSARIDHLAAREAELHSVIGPVSLYGDDGQKRSQATVLTEIGKRHHLFHDEGGDAYARVQVGDHAEVFLINSADYRDCLSRAYFDLSGSGANRNATGDALSTLSAMARFTGPCEPVHLRIGSSGDGIVIDDGSRSWRCITVNADGWCCTSRRIVNFRRSGKPLALPTPTTGDLSRLWRYVNVEKADRVLIAAWLLAALCPHGPYPILLLLGEQGTGKSQSSRTLKRFTDPSGVPLRAPPRDDKDLLVAALSSWVLALDNLSGATPQMSDALCRLSTGGGFSARRLYTDSDETLIAVQRPVILNGIDDLASRPDLAERCIHLTLPPLRQRATEADMAASFTEDAGPIMAAILDGLTLALHDVNTVNIGTLPRMADFAKWAAAGVPAMGFTRDEFVTAYRRNQSDAVALGLESSSVASSIRKIVECTGTWKGTARELLFRLNQDANDCDRRLPGWPHSPKGLTTVLRRLAPSLRHVGIESTNSRDSRNQYITLSCKAGGDVPQPPAESGAGGRLVDMADAHGVYTMRNRSSDLEDFTV
jgi:hypothetical protein